MPTTHEITSQSSPSQTGTIIRDRSKLPPDLDPYAEVVVGALGDLIGSIGAEQPGPGDRDLISYTEAVLRFCDADAGDRIAEGLHSSHLEDELLIQIEEILQAYRAAPGVGSGIVEFRIAGQGVGLEVDADVLQNARAIDIDQGLRVAEADEEVGVGDQRARQARDQAVLRNDGKAFVVPAVSEVRKHAGRVRQGVGITPRVSDGHEVRQLAVHPVLDALY